MIELKSILHNLDIYHKILEFLEKPDKIKLLLSDKEINSILNTYGYKTLITFDENFPQFAKDIRKHKNTITDIKVLLHPTSPKLLQGHRVLNNLPSNFSLRGMGEKNIGSRCFPFPYLKKYPVLYYNNLAPPDQHRTDSTIIQWRKWYKGYSNQPFVMENGYHEMDKINRILEMFHDVNWNQVPRLEKVVFRISSVCTVAKLTEFSKKDSDIPVLYFFSLF